jgi:hypothetical protein
VKPAAKPTAQTGSPPPPPPAFEADWESEAPPADWDNASDTEPYVGDMKPRPQSNSNANVIREPAPQTNSPTRQPASKPANGVGNGYSNGNGYTSPPPRTVIVELSTENGNWRRACQQLLNTAAKFNGRDKFYVKLPEHNLKVHFPQHSTKFCDDLTAELERVGGVLSVSATE